ncbi:hypothetical protein J2T13_004657 [Paenibacillus sp. DS2015]|uniref:hypothetical protein n=1 Tax=Paenibacillus sp. DS2015 TaxID=3373917 RepID=UPI003D1C4C2F
MRNNIANGWKSVKDQFYVVIILFLYQLICGYFLYRLVQSAVVPLFLRYPDPPPNELSKILFYVEGQLSLTNNETVHSYLWILLGMLLLRMILTPLIHAGILYGLHKERVGEPGLFFFKGIQQLWKPMALLYWIEIGLVLIPAYWVIPKLYDIGLTGFLSPSIWIQAVPYMLAWYVYRYIIHQLILYVQFGVTGRAGILSSIRICLRYTLSVMGISLILGLSCILLFSLFTGMSLWWTGLIGLIIQQAYHFISCLFKLWGITAQFDLWYNKKFR